MILIGLNVSQCLNEVCNGCADAHRCSLYGINAQGMISGLSLSKSDEPIHDLNQSVEKSTSNARAILVLLLQQGRKVASSVEPVLSFA